MNAAVVEEHGTPRYGEFEEPTAREGALVVEVAAAGVNPVDVARAAGTFYTGPDPVPFVAGLEGVGTLDDGRRVYFDTPLAPFGSMAERTLVAAEGGTIEVPDGVDDAVAVALGIAGFAAWLPLSWRARLQPGETVLVLGATGVAGGIAVQAAKLLGAGRVVAAGRSKQALERLEALGADATVPIDLPSGDDASAEVAAARDELTAAFHEAAGGDVDVVIDPIWGVPAVAALAALGMRGRLIQIGQSAGAVTAVPSALIRGKLAEIRGHTTFAAPYDVKEAAYRAMAEHAAAGRLVVDVDRIPLNDVAAAWERQRSGSGGTKLVLVP